MADVEEQSIVAEIEDVVQRNRQFDDAEIGGEVAPALPHLLVDRIADLGGDLRQTVLGKGT